LDNPSQWAITWRAYRKKVRLARVNDNVNPNVKKGDFG